MRQALAAHARADLGLVEKVDRALFEHARPDARLDIGAALAFEMIASMPARCSKWPRSRPAGPAPIMATCVRCPAIDLRPHLRALSALLSMQLLYCIRIGA